MTLFFLIAAAALAAEPQGQSEMSQNITVIGKSAVPTLSVPPPTPARPVVDEVLKSLSLGRGGGESPTETIRVSPEKDRVEQPFPEAPYLALSPENIQALYDSWTFEVLSDDGQIATRSQGVSILRESIDWDGSGTDGRLALTAGRRYHYRFTGRRGGRQFVIESDPVALRSFTRREFSGETRMEVDAADIFKDGKSAYAPGARRYLDAMAEALRSGDARADGSYRFELYAKAPSGRLAAARAKALTETFSAALAVDAKFVIIQLLPVERGEALAAFAPPAKGAPLRNE